MKSALQLQLLDEADIPRSRETPRQLVIQMPSDIIVTLEKFHQEQNGTVALRTLEDQAAKGLIPGAYKVKNKWWINRLAMIQQGLSSIGEVSEGKESKEAGAAPPAARPWRGGNQGPERRQPALSGPETQGKPPARARYRP